MSMRLKYKATKAIFDGYDNNGRAFYFVGDVYTSQPERWIEQNKAHNKEVKARREENKLYKFLD